MEQLENRSLLTTIGNGLSALPDSYSLDEDTTLNFSAPGVLANDAGTSAVIVTNPTNGSLTFNANGSFSFTPTANFYGSDSFLYQAIDGVLASNAITVTLNIADVPEPPVAVGDSYQTDEDMSLTMSAPGVLGNDQGQSLTAAATSTPYYGSVTMNSDGSFIYTPNSNYSGPDSFWYSIDDGVNALAYAQVVIAIAAVNDPPVAANQNFSTAEDTQLFVYSSAYNGIFGGATDADGDWTFTPNFLTQPTHGTLYSSSFGSFTYTPDAEYAGIDSFTYSLSDAWSTSNIATVNLTITPVNDAPVAANDTFTMVEDVNSFGAELLDNDFDLDGPYRYANLVTNVSHGNIILSMNGWFTYNPAPNYVGTDSFSYYMSDGLAPSNTVTVMLTITEVNDVPIGVADYYITNEDTPFYLWGTSIHDNDSDIETSNYSLVASLFDTTNHGSLSLASNGTFNYSPDANFFGIDTFTYRTYDGLAESELTTVTITVLAVNDTPTATDQSYTIDEDTELVVSAAAGLLFNSADIDGDTVNFFTIVNPPTHGTVSANYDGSFTYIPTADYNGPDSFYFAVSDGSSYALATASLIVLAVDDLEVEILTQDRFAEEEDSVDGSFIVTRSGSPATALIVYFTISGTAVAGADYQAIDGSVTIPANQNHASITIDPVDDLGGEPQESVRLVLVSSSKYVLGAHISEFVSMLDNDLFDGALPGISPVVSIGDAQVNEGGNLVFPVFLAEPVSAPVTISYGTSPGTATAQFDFEPIVASVTINPGESYQEIIVQTFPDERHDEGQEWLLCNLIGITSGDIAHATGYGVIDDVLESLFPEPSVVVGADDQQVSTDMDSALEITLTGTGPQNTTLQYMLVSSPVHGVLTGVAPSLIYTPDDGYSGHDSLTFRTSDGVNLSPLAEVAIEVTPSEPFLLVHSENWAEGENGGFYIYRYDGRFTQPLTISWAISDVTATAGDDYVGSTGTVTFEPRQGIVWIPIEVIDDGLVEGVERLTLSAAIQGSTEGDASFETGIIDDEVETSVLSWSFVFPDLIEPETSGEILYYDVQIQLSAPAPAAITFQLSSIDGSAVEGSDFELVNSSVAIGAGSSTGVFQVGIKGDGATNGIGEFYISATATNSFGYGWILTEALRAESLLIQEGRNRPPALVLAPDISGFCSIYGYDSENSARCR